MVNPLGGPVGGAHEAVGLWVDPHDRGDEADAAVARDRGDLDGFDGPAIVELEGRSITGAELIVSLRIVAEGAVDGNGGRVAAHEGGEAKGEWVGEWIDGQVIVAQALEVAGFAGADAGVAEVLVDDVNGSGGAL